MVSIKFVTQFFSPQTSKSKKVIINEICNDNVPCPDMSNTDKIILNEISSDSISEHVTAAPSPSSSNLPSVVCLGSDKNESDSSSEHTNSPLNIIPEICITTTTVDSTNNVPDTNDSLSLDFVSQNNSDTNDNKLNTPLPENKLELNADSEFHVDDNQNTTLTDDLVTDKISEKNVQLDNTESQKVENDLVDKKPKKKNINLVKSLTFNTSNIKSYLKSSRNCEKIKYKPSKLQRLSSIKITDLFPVRKSTRKTERSIKEMKLDLIKQSIIEGKDFNVQVKDFGDKGRGLVSMIPFDKDEFILEYSGELIKRKEAKLREKKYAKDESVGSYMYYFRSSGKSYCIDATVESERLGRLINHSMKNANVSAKIMAILGRPHIYFVAKRNIEVNEELVYDYGDRCKSSILHNPWLKY